MSFCSDNLISGPSARIRHFHPFNPEGQKQGRQILLRFLQVTKKIMRHIIAAIICALSCTSTFAMSKDERKEFLDAIRPEATRKAGQPVRFKVSHLNHEGEWAVLVGSLLAEEGKTIDWEKAEDCDPTLDKLLWVVARRGQQGWKVKEMYICSPEPPYWNLNPRVDFARPCGIYAALEISGDETAEQQCRAYQAKKRHSKN